MSRKRWQLNSAIINTVYSSELFFQVKTAYQINSTHENYRVEVKINNVWGKQVIILKKRLFQPGSINFESTLVINLLVLKDYDLFL